jgi:hypothetical protein
MTLNLLGERSFFVTPSTYALGKAMGVERAGAAFLEMIDKPSAKSDCLPSARMICRLQEMGKVTMWHGWGTDLPKLRSRAAYAAFEGACDQWVTLDDDVECDTATLRSLVEMAGHERIAVLPCLIRGSKAEAGALNVVFEGALLTPSPGGLARPCKRGGTGCMVVGGQALARMMMHYRDELGWLDDDQRMKVALFEARVQQQQWFGEDYSFCNRARSLGIEILSPAAGRSNHDGRILDLAAIDVRP